MNRLLTASLAALLALATPAFPAFAAPEPLGIALEGWAYPWPVQYTAVAADRGEEARLAYMDVQPMRPNGQTVVLLHGKNFFGAYWKDTIAALQAAGYRVVVPDQIGFGKSSKPDMAYSFHRMAAHTKALLTAIGVKRAAVVGHSMGGMLAVRFALLYPNTTTRLVLEDPIGLEDYRVAVPYADTETLYRANLAATEAELRAYQRAYYVSWKPAYEDYVQAQFRWTLSAEYPRVARAAALTEQMIYQQPVVHELANLKVPTLLVVGDADRTVVGRARVPAAVLPKLGQYPQLAQKAVKAIPGAKLTLLAKVGHIPHLEAPTAFHEALLGFLK